MENYLNGFVKDLEVRNYSPESIRKYAHCVKVFFGFLAGRTDLRKVGKVELNAYLEALSRNPNYSVHHVAANVRAVKCFFRYLKKAQVVLHDFSSVLVEPKKPKALPKEPLSSKEVKLMLEAPDLRKPLGIRDRAILETFYSSGIRANEMCCLTLLDVDLENGLLFIREGKGKKDRMVPLGKHACYFIKAYLEMVRPGMLAKGKAPLKTNRLWISRKGNAISKSEITFLVRGYRLKAGIEKQVTAHSFRRTLAVELIRNECDFLAVKEILGHSRSETTLRYCALSGVELKEVLKKCHPRYDTSEVDAKPHITSFGS